jgi:hypothetical protein
LHSKNSFVEGNQKPKEFGRKVIRPDPVEKKVPRLAACNSAAADAAVQPVS